MQTPRDISYTGNPTGGTTAYPAVLPAAHEATENSDNIFYRTIRTVMKKQLICLLASAGLLAAGCSTENAPETTGYGTLSVSCTADTSIDTAAGASGTPEAPAAGAFSLTVTGETGTQKWDTLTEFEQSETVFRMGSYTVAIAHGDPDAEGAGKPYYYAEQKIEVLPRRTVNADLTATVANSQVVIRATEQFLAYFHDARFTVTTASGNEFAFTPGSDPADEPVFVKGGTRLTVTGTARRQSPTGTGEGPEVTFSAQTLDATTPRTCHIITYDAKNAGSATLTITLGEDYTDTRTLDCEVSEGFDIAEIQKYVSGEKKYRILAFSELTRFTVSVGDKSYDALNGTTEGISLEPVDKYNVRLTLSDAFFASCQAGDQKVTLRIEDANGGSSEVATTYRLEGLVPVTADDYDLWANTVTLRVVSFTPGTTVQFGLRSSGGEWQPMAGTSQGDDFITATYAPQWVPQTVKEQTVYTQAAGTGIIATHSYDFRAIINGTETTGTFTAGEVQPIPNGDMSGWSMTGGFAFPNAAGESFWSSGNNTMTKTLCTSTDVKFGKSAPAAKLTSTNMLVLAAGNLFTGEFAYKSFTGTVQFGQTYAFTARPSAMKVKYHAHVGTVDKVRTSGDICPYIKKGDPDMARIFVAIVDWNAPHEVVSGMTTTKGAWDPEKGIDNVSEGKILGYGSLWITQSTDGEDMQDAELDIVWYDHETRPAEGKYSLVISCACNAYGDYFTGCSKNVMYVDDFEWVY